MAIPWALPWSIETTFQIVAAAITALSLVVAFFAFRFSRRQHLDALKNFEREHIAAIKNFEKTLKVTYYAELDRMYFDLVAMRVGKPHLWGKSAKRTDEQTPEYEHYRFLVWNYLETVFDRCFADKDDAQEDDLHKTWEPAFKFESKLHGTVIGPEYSECFKETFRDRLKKVS